MCQTNDESSKNRWRPLTTSEKAEILKECYVEGIPVARVCAQHRIHPDQIYRWTSILFFCIVMLTMGGIVTFLVSVNQSKRQEAVKQLEKDLDKMMQLAHENGVTEVMLPPLVPKDYGWLRAHAVKKADQKLAVAVQNIFSRAKDIRFSRTSHRNEASDVEAARMVCKILSFKRINVETYIDSISLELVLDHNDQVIWSTICPFNAVCSVWEDEVIGGSEKEVEEGMQ